MPGDRRKILYVSFDVIPEPTGSSARATELLRGLTPLYQVDALTAKTPDHSHIERYFGARLLRVPVGAGDLPARAQAFERAVRRQLESDEYELVHVTDPYGGYPLCELKGQYGFKVVYEVAGLPSVELRYTHPQLESDRRFFAKLRRQEIYCLMNADAVVAPSRVTKSYVASLGVPEPRVHVIPALADLPLFAELPDPTDDPELRLVYVGRDASWEGLSTLLFALKAAGEKCRVRCTIVGPRSGTAGERRRLEELAKGMKLFEEGSPARVELLEAVEHEKVPALIAAADAGVAPLEASGRNLEQGASPAKIAEYLAAGRAVIASDLPIVRELVEDREQALLVPPGDAGALSRAIVELAQNPALRRQMGEKARQRAKERLDADRARRAIIGLYRDLLEPSIIVSPEVFQPPAVAGKEEAGAEMPTSTIQLAVADGPPPETQPKVEIEPPTNVTGIPLPPEPEPATGATQPRVATGPTARSQGDATPVAAAPAEPAGTEAPTGEGPALVPENARGGTLEATRPRAPAIEGAPVADKSEPSTDPARRDAPSGEREALTDPTAALPPAFAPAPPSAPPPAETTAPAAPAHTPVPAPPPAPPTAAPSGDWFEQLVFGAGPGVPVAPRRDSGWEDPSQVVMGRLLTPAPVPGAAPAVVPPEPAPEPPVARPRAPVIIPPRAAPKHEAKGRDEKKPPPLPAGKRSHGRSQRRVADEDSSPGHKR